MTTSPNGSDPKPLDILIVDDKAENLRLLTRMLDRRGYKTETAHLGRIALQRITEMPPRLILLDINMPEMDGFEVCQRIREREESAHIPVIFLSAFSEPDDKVKGFGVGAVDYITKPFHYHEVIARVETHLELSRQREEIRELRERERTYFSDITEVKDRIMHRSAHDLRNPLASIQLSAALLRSMIPDRTDRIEKYLNKIDYDVDRMLDLILDMLDIATADYAKKLEEEVISIQKFWHSVVVDTQERVIDHDMGIQLIPFEPDQEVKIPIDPAANILRNFIMLHLQFSSPGDEIQCFSIERATDDSIMLGVKLLASSGFEMITADSKRSKHLALNMRLLNLVASIHNLQLHHEVYPEKGQLFGLILTPDRLVH